VIVASNSEINEAIHNSKKHSTRTHWAGWDEAEFCDNCGRHRNDARLYKKKVPYFIWEKTPWEVYDRKSISVILCEVCVAFLNEKGELP